MPSNLLTLLRVQYENTSWLNHIRNEKDKKKKNRSIMMAIIMCFVFIMMAGYSFALSYGLGKLGLSQLIPGYALAITSLITLFFTFFITNGYLFAFKDYDMLMSLPFSTRTIITVKFLLMYVANVLFTALVFLSMGITYAIWVKPPFTVFLMWIIGIFIAPLFPMTIAAILGAIIAKLGAKFRHKTLIQVVLTITLVFSLFALSFWLQDGSMKNNFNIELTNIGKMLLTQIHRIYPLSILYNEAIWENKLVPFLLLCLFSFVWYGIFLLVLEKNYMIINTALKAHPTISNYHVEGLKENSVLWALVQKEARRFFSSVTYITNIGMGLIMALGSSLVVLFMGFDKLLNLLNVPKLDHGFLYIIPFGIAIIVNMSCTTAVSWSLEGKNLWIVESLPISKAMIFKGKMAFNLLLVMPVSILCTMIFIFTLKVPFLLAILYLLISSLSVCFSTAWGMWMNILFPNFAWENEVEVIKQGMSSMIGIFSAILFYLALGAITFFLSNMISGEVIMAGIIIILFLITIFLNKKISNIGDCYET